MDLQPTVTKGSMCVCVFVHNLLTLYYVLLVVLPILRQTGKEQVQYSSLIVGICNLPLAHNLSAQACKGMGN